MKKLVFLGRKKTGLLDWLRQKKMEGSPLTLEKPRSNIGGILFHSNIYIC